MSVLTGTNGKRSPEAATALMFFLSHYIANESKISMENRTESSVRAFRLLYTDTSVDRACFATSSLNETINNIYNNKCRITHRR